MIRKYFQVLVILVLLLLSISNSYCQMTPFSLENAQSFVANQTNNSFSVERSIELFYKENRIGILFHLKPQGFVILSSQDEKSVMAFSFENNFICNNDFDEQIISQILFDIQKNIRSEDIYYSRNPVDTTVGPLVHSLFGQVNCKDENGALINVSNLYTPNNYAPGCVAVSLATLQHYYQWPIKGNGQHFYTDNYGSSKGTYSANFSDSEYDWDNIVNRYEYKETTQEQREALATLMFDDCVALDMDFEYNGSTSNVNRIPTTGLNYFRFSARYASATSPIFWKAVDTNIVHLIPVIFAISASNGAGHSIVCDGFKIQDNQEFHHLNMGWWGTTNGWYKIKNSFKVGGYNKIDGGVINFVPVPMLQKPQLSFSNTKIDINWLVSPKISPDAFEIQVQKDKKGWKSLGDDFIQTSMTLDVDAGVEKYEFRVKTKIDGKWYADSWSNIAVIDVKMSEILDVDSKRMIVTNPFNDILQIRLDRPSLVQIFNQTGQLIFEESFLSDAVIPTDSWENGIYFLNINMKYSTKVLKAIKL